MTDTETMSQDTTQPETQAVSKAVGVLCAQYVMRVQQEATALAQIAFETDKLDPAAGWRLDIEQQKFVKVQTA